MIKQEKQIIQEEFEPEQIDSFDNFDIKLNSLILLDIG